MLNDLYLASFLVIGCGSILLWQRAIRRQLSGDSFLAPRETTPVPLGLVDVLVVYSLSFFSQVVALSIALPFLGLKLGNLTDATGAQQAWLSILIAFSQLVAVAMSILVLVLRYRRADVVGWQPGRIIEDIGLGGKAFVMVVPPILLVQWLLTQVFDYSHSTLKMMSESGSALAISSAWLSAGLVAPVWEELFFRGVLQGWLQRIGSGSSAKTDQKIGGGWGEDERSEVAKKIYWPILVTAALFGLSHLGQGPAPISLFLFGLALGYLYRQTGSILPCIILHMLLNGFSLFWFTLNVLFGEREPAKEALAGYIRALNWMF